MKNRLLQLKPEAIWAHFYEITQIPRPSGHEEKIRQYVLDFAQKHGIECQSDATGNVVLRKPATAGMENRQGIILQAHLDMVPQKNNDKKFDFEKDPIQPVIDGDWVKADGTTLGADNGIGMAAILAALEDNSLIHGPLEGLFTLTEETGMVGAFGLDPHLLKGDILLNLDSEEEGELCVGCAGGLDANVTIPYKEEVVSAGMQGYEIKVGGLRGGHSGSEIILQRGNSNKILARFLTAAAEKSGLRVASIDGGGLRNAIPREARAIVTVPAANAEKLGKMVAECEAVYKKELEAVDPDLSLTATALKSVPEKLLTADSQRNILYAVYGCPNGVVRMSDSMKGLVETSTNLARVVTEGGKAKVNCLLRSSVDSAKENLAQAMAAVFELAGGEPKFTGGYSGWKPDMDSPILHSMRETYKKLFGKTPVVQAIHAGLECGIIGGKYPKMDMISFGPSIYYPHSPDEKVEIATVEKFWRFLVETLKNAPQK